MNATHRARKVGMRLELYLLARRTLHYPRLRALEFARAVTLHSERNHDYCTIRTARGELREVELPL